MEFKPYTIFRVVGGNSQRKVFMEYEIIPYLVIKENPRYWTTSRDGRVELQQKRETSSTEWCNDIDNALVAVEKKIAGAMRSIQTSMMEIQATTFDALAYPDKLYTGKFREEKFTLKCDKILRRTGKAYVIDIKEMKTVSVKRKDIFVDKEKPVGRNYIYHHISLPHQGESPYEKWITPSLDVIKSLMRKYGEDRIRYLHQQVKKQRVFVKQYKQTQEYKDE